MSLKNTGVLTSILFLSNCASSQELGEFPLKIGSITDVVDMFPTSVQEIKDRTHMAMNNARMRVDQIIAIPSDQRTFENTAAAFDRAQYFFGCSVRPIMILELVSPDEQIRQASHEATAELQKFSIDVFASSQPLYQAFKEYMDGAGQQEKLNEAEKIFLDDVMQGFERNGLNLSQEKKEQVKNLNKELADISLMFSTNIAQENRTVAVKREELQGVDDDFINTLKHDEKGLLLLGADYPTYFKVMDLCTVESTRKKLYQLFMQRAYPVNMPVLESFIDKRDEMAHLVGFESYADFDVDNQMVKTTARVKTFLNDLIAKATLKGNAEYELLIKNLPTGVTLSGNGKIKPWDYFYIVAQYKKNKLKVDEGKIAEYFPVHKTIAGLMHIFEQFMNITLQEKPIAGLWSDEVKLIEVLDTQGTRLRGYILLDLFPRPNKYSHASSNEIVATVKTKDGIISPAINLVLANFPRPTATKPALLKHTDVTTFFHEFGHAIHSVLGSTELASQSGYNVKNDFVELPSQMLEEWMWDKDMLKLVSHHYQTGEPLSDDLIAKKIELKNFDIGYWLLRQLYFAQLSLEYFLQGTHKNTDAIAQSLYTTILPFMVWDSSNHSQASFGHLTEYGAKYYGYLWSRVFALDIFSQIKKVGLLNPVIGKKYVDTILAVGGGEDPNDMLKKFLGREPNADAFFEDVGLKD